MKFPIYLDYAATTPVDPRVAEKMVDCLTMEGNFLLNKFLFSRKPRYLYQTWRPSVYNLI